MWSRYSFIGVRAAATLTERDGRGALDRAGCPAGLPSGGDPLRPSRETLRLLHTPRDPTVCRRSPRAWSATSGYDIVRRLERLPDSNPDDLQPPRAGAAAGHRPGRPRPPRQRGLADRQRDQLRRHRRAGRRGVRGRGGPGRGADRGARPSRPRRRRSPSPRSPSCRSAASAPPEEFQAAVAAAVEEIKAGEAFQIVVSQRFEVDTTADALDVYRVLRLTNPSPYMYLLRLPTAGSTSSAPRPEALVTVTGRTWRSPTRSPAPSRAARRRRRTPRWRRSCWPTPRSGPST